MAGAGGSPGEDVRRRIKTGVLIGCDHRPDWPRRVWRAIGLGICRSAHLTVGISVGQTAQLVETRGNGRSFVHPNLLFDGQRRRWFGSMTASIGGPSMATLPTFRAVMDCLTVAMPLIAMFLFPVR